MDELTLDTRVRYVADGPQHYLRGVHGTVRTTSTETRLVGVQFDGHGAIWPVHPRHLTRLEA